MTFPRSARNSAKTRAQACVPSLLHARPGPARPPEEGSARLGLCSSCRYSPHRPRRASRAQSTAQSTARKPRRTRTRPWAHHGPLSADRISQQPPTPLCVSSHGGTAVWPGQAPAVLLMVGPASPAPRPGTAEARRPATRGARAPGLPSLPPFSPEQPSPQVARKPGGCEGGGQGTERWWDWGRGALLPAWGAASQGALCQPLRHLLGGVTVRRGESGAGNRLRKLHKCSATGRSVGVRPARASRQARPQVPDVHSSPPEMAELPGGEGVCWQQDLRGRGWGAASRECPSTAGPGPGPGPGIHWHSVAQAVPGDETVTCSPGQRAPRGLDDGEHCAVRPPSPVLPGLSMRPRL